MRIKVMVLALTFASMMGVGISAVDHEREPPCSSLKTFEKELWILCDTRHTPKIDDYDKLVDAATKCEEYYRQKNPTDPECQEKGRIYRGKVDYYAHLRDFEVNVCNYKELLETAPTKERTATTDEARQLIIKTYYDMAEFARESHLRVQFLREVREGLESNLKVLVGARDAGQQPTVGDYMDLAKGYYYCADANRYWFGHGFDLAAYFYDEALKVNREEGYDLSTQTLWDSYNKLIAFTFSKVAKFRTDDDRNGDFESYSELLKLPYTMGSKYLPLFFRFPFY